MYMENSNGKKLRRFQIAYFSNFFKILYNILESHYFKRLGTQKSRETVLVNDFFHRNGMWKFEGENLQKSAQICNEKFEKQNYVFEPTIYAKVWRVILKARMKQKAIFIFFYYKYY